MSNADSLFKRKERWDIVQRHIKQILFLLEHSEALYEHGTIIAKKDLEAARYAEDKAQVDLKTASDHIEVLSGDRFRKIEVQTGQPAGDNLLQILAGIKIHSMIVAKALQFASASEAE